MITLNELQDTWKTDCKIDELNLGSESIKTAELHSKYLNHLTNFKLQLRKFESQMLTLRRVKWRYFRGELSKLELDDLGWEQSLNSRTWDIKNAVEWTKFTNGSF